MDKEYLENPLCSFTPLFNIDYRRKVNIVSCVFFKMYPGGYKNLDMYIRGIKRLLYEIRKNMRDFRLRLFIDKGIYEDKEIFQQLNNMKIQMVLYHCNDFVIEDLYHKGTFGTIIRFFPFFNFPNNDTDYVIPFDIDVDEGTIERLKTLHLMYNIIKTNKEMNQTKISFVEMLFIPIMRNTERFYKNYINGFFYAQGILTKFKFDKNLIIEYLNQVEKFEFIPSPYVNFDNVFYKKNIEASGYTNFKYGVDEYFLRTIFSKKLMDKREIFTTKIRYQITYDIYWKIVDNKELSLDQKTFYFDFMKYIFKKDRLFVFDDFTKAFEYFNRKTKILDYSKTKYDRDELEYVFYRVYKFFIINYKNCNTGYIDKSFLNIILNNKFLGKAFFDGIITYNTNVKNFIISSFEISEKYIDKLRNKKNELKIKDINIPISDKFYKLDLKKYNLEYSEILTKRLI